MKSLEMHWDLSSMTDMSWILWASSEKMAMVSEKMSNRFSHAVPLSSQLFQLTILLLILAVVVGTVYFLSKNLNLTNKNSLNTDFRSIYQKLCTIHRLSFKERLLIRKVIKAFGILDPLLIFVDPKYFHSALTRNDFKANQKMLHHLINKLFGFVSDKESVSLSSGQIQTEESANESPMTHFPQMDFPEAVFHVALARETGLKAETAATEFRAQNQEAPQEPDKEMPLEVLSGSFDRKKPFYPRIPGSQAFSSLASTIHEVRTEIATKSLQHNLLSGRENNRTFKVHDFAEPTARDPHVSIPKNASQEESVENQRTFHIEDAHQEPWNPKNNYGEVFTVEDVALLEAIITGKQEKNSL